MKFNGAIKEKYETSVSSPNDVDKIPHNSFGIHVNMFSLRKYILY